jgi:hypothetical protein
MLIFLVLLLASAELASNCELIFHTANCNQRINELLCIILCMCNRIKLLCKCNLSLPGQKRIVTPNAVYIMMIIYSGARLGQ